MQSDVETLISLLQSMEDEHLEFKEAKTGFGFDKLMDYCVALANEGGGELVLGVSSTRPRKVVGTSAFRDINKLKGRMLDVLRHRVEIKEIEHPDGRVLVFQIPSHPLGLPLHHKGCYLMRSGESLVAMTPDVLKKIFDEIGLDFSAEVCGSASMESLSPEAIIRFRKRWLDKSRNEGLEKLSDDQILTDAELLVDGTPTYAALVLLGSRKGLGRFLPQSELVFEYRSSEASAKYHQRKEYREGFLLYHDHLWEQINARNDIQQYQDGLFRRDIPTFNESVVREALLNAICHRDYRLGNSIFVRQYPRKLEILSPGGFIEGITPQDIVWRQEWRNRRIAETLSKCGLVERSGQGADLMFEQCIKEGKATPDFTGTDEHQVSLTLYGNIQDVEFLKFLEKLGSEKLTSFTIEDLLVIDFLHHEKEVPPRLAQRIPHLREQGVLEKVGRGRGVRHILSRRFYTFLGRKGTYTRKKGLNRKANKALILQHIKENTRDGSRLEDLLDVTPNLTYQQVRGLLQELQSEGSVVHTGRTRGSRWYLTRDGEKRL
jgi:ATP-dependent DNA helicase RecG